MASSSIDSLLNTSKKDPYTVKASLDGGSLQTTEVTGDREGSAFAKASETSGMGKADFLTLLTKQLQYQDPMEPMDNTQMVAQLAQFSTLETTTTQTKALEAMQKSFETSLGIQSNSAQSVTNSTSVSLIGKSVRLRQNTVDWNGKGTADLKVHLGENKSAKVKIMNDKDEIINEFLVDTKDATNAGSIKWDGKDLTGKPVGADSYKIVIEGQDKDPSLYCFVEDMVDGVRYTAQGPVVKIAGTEIPVGNILEVNPEKVGGTGGVSDMSMAQALGLVGKDVKYRDTGTVYAPKYGESKTYDVELAGGSSATVVLKDGNGNVVQKYPVPDKDGSLSIEIPMEDKSGSGGKYSVSIENNSGAYFYKSGKISGVVTSGTGVQLKVNGTIMNPKEILEVTA